MAYDVPSPSREKVKKAGKVLINVDANADEFEQAMAVMSQWRSLHSYPINIFQAMLRGKVKRLGFKSPIIAQRLKRAPSIVRKLTRFSSMSLSRMQDIGGIRIVLPIFAKLKGLIVTAKHIETSSSKSEPPRLYRRVFYLSQAAMPDRIKLS